LQTLFQRRAGESFIDIAGNVFCCPSLLNRASFLGLKQSRMLPAWGEVVDTSQILKQAGSPSWIKDLLMFLQMIYLPCGTPLRLFLRRILGNLDFLSAIPAHRLLGSANSTEHSRPRLFHLQIIAIVPSSNVLETLQAADLGVTGAFKSQGWRCGRREGIP
jgi:hypothetical protein